MNTDELETLNEKCERDFNTALNIYNNNYSHDELVNFLKNGSVAEKQAAVLELDTIANESDAKILMDNLTGCDGKIREAVSFRLKEFVEAHSEYYTGFYETFLEAVADINGNICRNTLEALNFMKTSDFFVGNFCKILTERVLKLADEAKNFDIQDGKYKINKKIFKLYWYLEAVCEFVEFMESDVLLEILSLTGSVKDYTIREKTAKILSKLNDDLFAVLKSELSKDDNYYVLKALNLSGN